MSRRYWRITDPDYESDYQDSFVNGQGTHRLGLPGIRCDGCGQTWSGTRVLPFECPEVFRGVKEINRGWPVPSARFVELRDALLSELRREGHETDSLQPGDDFQPVYLRFPSRPRSDFLWSTLGSVIVSQRVKDLFESEGVSGVAFCPAVIEKVGSRESVGPIPMPESGEPEDVMGEVEEEASPEAFGPLYEMIVTAESGRPPGTEVTSRCEVCGREEYDQHRRLFKLTPEMPPDSDVFLFATTLYIIVNEKVRDLIVRHRLTNVKLREADPYVG